MYSWGGGTKDWKKPGAYNYNSARKPYLDKLAAASKARGGRSYVKGSSPNSKLVHTGKKEIFSDSENPLIVAVDVTGSMERWPAEIFDRLPLLYQTLSQYRPDLEVCFAAIGDAYSDEYPLQINNFGKGVALEDHINALYPEGGGGGQIHETYELFGHYILNHCKTPKAKNPFLLIFGDEKFYENVNPDQAEHFMGYRPEKAIESKSMWKNLMQKFNMFYLQKPYGWGDNNSITQSVTDTWAEAIGKQRIIALPSMERAVDVGMAIVARHWGKFGDYTKNISARQDSSQIKLVMKSIRYIPVDPNTPITRASKLLVGSDGNASKRLDQ
ncbi:hypothetical protein AYK26_05935 [Euryarchaeota archaeon SM23-78]|nr:MAG: hypothetical protein AYK26_05935 [Euryarchaeota archaeon SM23-78]